MKFVILSTTGDNIFFFYSIINSVPLTEYYYIHRGKGKPMLVHAVNLGKARERQQLA